MEQLRKNLIGKTEAFIWRPRLALLRLRGRKRVALASYPRSGNTWLRLLVEEATGEKTGTAYPGREVIERGSEGVLIKTHEWDMYRYTHAIHMLRNPFDVFASYYRYSVDIFKQQGLTWEDFVPRAVEEWRGHSSRWLRAAQAMPVYTLRYEDLLADTQAKLRDLLTWLGFTPAEEAIEAAIEATQLDSLRRKYPRGGEKFFRQGKSGLGLSQFSPEQRAFVIERLGALMRELGYSTDEQAQPLSGESL